MTHNHGTRLYTPGDAAAAFATGDPSGGSAGVPTLRPGDSCVLSVRAILDGMPGGLIVLGPGLQIHAMSPRVDEILGPPADESPDPERAWPHLAGTALLRGLAGAMQEQDTADGSESTLEEYLPTLSRWVEVRTRRSGGMLHVHLRDVTDRKDAQAELERYASDLLAAKAAIEHQASELKVAREDAESARLLAERARAEAERARAEAERERAAAEASSLAKSSFLANMSHEIRTPMTAIVGFADLMLEPGQTSDQRRECLHTIRRNARHLLELINDILDLSKIEAGKMNVELLDVDLTKVVAEVVSMMRPRCLEKGLDFQLEYAGPVRRSVTTDPLRLRQILVNLLGNAVKFTTEGMVMLRVSSPDEGRTTAFEVTDTGVGIAPDAVCELFEPFVQGDGSTTRRFGGTGLGLAISRRLARALGGDISVASQPAKGSTFRLTIDAGVGTNAAFCTDVSEILGGSDATASNADAGQFDDTPLPPGKLPPCRVLLVEDGKDNQRLLKLYLDRAGASVELADNGIVALAAIEAAADAGSAFDVVLMDMQMPELDGYGATSELRRRGFRLPVVALTAHAMADDRAKCIGVGCDDYLTKPVDRDALVAVIRTQLARRPREGVAPAVAPSSVAAAVAESPATGPVPASLAPAAESPTLGTDAGLSLVRSEFHDDPEFAPLLEEFVGGLPESVGEIEALRAARRWEDLARRIHQIKGAGGGYGFPEITKVAAAAEGGLKNDTPDALERVDALVLLCRRVAGYDPRREARGAASLPQDRKCA